MTEVEDDPKAPFSIATTEICKRGRYYVPWITLLLIPYLIKLSVNQGGIKYHFWVFGMTRPGIEPRSPGPLANTLLIRLMARLKGWYAIKERIQSPTFILLAKDQWFYEKRYPLSNRYILSSGGS